MSRALFTACLTAVLLVTTTIARAEEPAALASGTAAWTADGKVQLDVSWMGSACEKPVDVTVEASDGDATTDVVVISTETTAEVCTMQLVAVTFSGTVAVEPNTERVSVTALAPDGQPRAAGNVEITKAE